MRAQGGASDIIAAIATPPGPGAIAVIRMSGAGSLQVADAVFRGRAPVVAAAGYTVHHGVVADARGEPIDEVLLTVFRAPHSYTGEDLVELGCHGSVVVSAQVLRRLVEAGARHAAPGEFTRRAFLNGKLDLSQAEAVMGLVAAQSEAAGRAALLQLEGRLGKRVGELRRELLDLCALLELELDFAEEGLALADRGDLGRKLGQVAGSVSGLASTYAAGRLLREGTGVVLAGKPNAGKSSLFNALLKESRAIVTAQPGTTRDLLEETIVLEGIPFRMQDTAGLREASEEAEEEGVKRGLIAAAAADILVVVVDPLDPPGEDELKEIRQRAGRAKKVIWAINKCDLLAAEGPPEARWARENEEVVRLSALTGAGVAELERCLTHAVSRQEIESVSLTITSQRHFRLLEEALTSLERGRQSLEDGLSNEFVALDVRAASSQLGEITGEITSDDILNSIFDRFCIGK